MPPVSPASRPPGITPPPLRDDFTPRRFIDFQRAGVALFVAGVLALGIGIATGSKADGKSSPASALTPVAQVIAPPNAGPDVPGAPANPAPGPPANTVPPMTGPANAVAPAPPQPPGPAAPAPPE